RSQEQSAPQQFGYYSTRRRPGGLWQAGPGRFACRLANFSGRKYKLAAPGAFKRSLLRTLFLSFPRKLMNTRWTPSGVPAHKGAALIIVLAFMALLTGLALAYFSHTATDRQLAQASFHDASANLLARTALDIIVSSLKREIAVAGVNVTQANIQSQRSGVDSSIPNLLTRCVGNASVSAPGVL